MPASVRRALIIALPLLLAACDTGPYHPGLHAHEDAATGSLMSGTDTGADQGISDTSVSGVRAGGPSGH